MNEEPVDKKLVRFVQKIHDKKELESVGVVAFIVILITVFSVIALSIVTGTI